MMHPRIVLPGALLGALLIGPTARALDLPVEDRTAANAESLRPAIEKWVAPQIDLILQHGPDAGRAREELSRQAEATSNTPVSSSFQLVYIDTVNKHIDKLLNSQDVADRLNGAIIVTRNAQATKLLSLQPTVVRLLNDDSPAVSLWGVKAAAALLPTVLNSSFAANNEKLTAALVTAVQNHPTSGAIVSDAYRALDLSDKNLPPAGLNKATDAMNAILATRVEQYVASIPNEMLVDKDPTAYLWRKSVLQASGDKQRQEAVQNLINLLSTASQRYAKAAGNDRLHLQDVSEAAGGALWNLMRELGHPNVGELFRPFTRIGQMNAANIQANVKAALVEVRKIDALKDIQDPPQVKPTEAAAGG